MDHISLILAFKNCTQYKSPSLEGLNESIVFADSKSPYFRVKYLSHFSLRRRYYFIFILYQAL